MAVGTSRREAYLKEREDGFDMNFGTRSKLPPYNALLDSNMKHYFENENVQTHLLQTGQIDSFGRIISLDKQRTRLRVIENEIARAEQFQKKLQKEEDRVRQSIQHERTRDIERRRYLEIVARRREEKQLRLELDRTEREILGRDHLYSRDSFVKEKGVNSDKKGVNYTIDHCH